MTLIFGGSGSGKSGYAERYISEISRDSIKYYLATMQVLDGEGQKKVEKHRIQRSGKGFFTIEQPVQIEEAIEKMKRLEQIEQMEQTEHGHGAVKRAVLLECISNLAANEMFFKDTVKDGKEVAEKIISGIQKLQKSVKQLVIVSNNVFEDGISYDETTMEYIRTMGRINERLAQMAELVIEVVVGIPVIIKEKRS